MAAEGVSRRKSVYLSGKRDRVVKDYFSESEQILFGSIFYFRRIYGRKSKEY